MERCINVGFTFNGKEYFAIIRRQTINNKKYYKIRIMNQRLDALLHKSNCNIINEYDGYIALPEAGKWSEGSELLLTIAKELKKELGREGRDHDFGFVTDFRLLTPY
ncbi:hypothetical protein ACX0G7_08575 [Flavitalea antarctica]